MATATAPISPYTATISTVPRVHVTTSALVLDLADVSRANIPLVGGKGANLGEMLHADLPVPPGFVLTVDAYELARQTAGIGPRIDALLRTVKVDDPAALQ